MTELLLIRHGETDWNIEKRVQGYRDIALNREGELQALALGRALFDEPIAAIFSSDLQRTLHTAQAIAQPRGMTVQQDAGLRERCFGAFEGLLHPEIGARYPEDYAAWKRRDMDARYPRGELNAETLREFSTRAIAAVARLAVLANRQKIVIVTHSGVLDSIYRRATNRGYEHPRDFDVLNGSINRVLWDGAQFEIVQWADVAHLSRISLDESDNLA